MATEHFISIEGQPYFNSSLERQIDVFYTEPDIGVNENTGILLLISGFEGDTHSNVYKKMRMEFSDHENLVVIQCNYFGYQFMGSETMRSVHKEMADIVDEINRQAETQPELAYQDIITDKELNETSDTFCELGIFQALDNLKAVKKVMKILEQRNLNFNHDRIIAYGYSHGAYLALLCNAITPNLFSAIIDNSAWLYPVYLYRPRVCSSKWGNPKVRKENMIYIFVKYQGRTWIQDLEIYHLRRLYRQFTNRAQILSFHGEDDGLIHLNEKESFLKNIPNTSLHTVTNDNLDDKIFHNTKHGMGSDFLELFYYVTEKHSLTRKSPCSKASLLKPIHLNSKKFQYEISDEFEITQI